MVVIVFNASWNRGRWTIFSLIILKKGHKISVERRSEERRVGKEC